MRRRLWTFLALLACVSGEYLMGGHLDNNAGSKTRSGKTESSSTSERKTRLDDLDLDLVAAESTVAAVAAAGAETSTDDDGDVPRNHIPYPFVFNGGKPFSLEKDPITGKIDFEKAPPVKALNYTSSYRERGDTESEGDDGGKDGKENIGREKAKGKDGHDVGQNEINTYMPNFHDFLNLPVHYSSDKYGSDKYPLISSSYANTKVQSGANSYSTYNHRPHYPESDMYVLPVKNTYAPMIKTSTYRTTTVNDLKAKWTSTASPSTTTTSAPPITTNSSRTVLSTSTRAPAVTTWKPSSTPVALHSIDRTEMENEKNLLPIEKLHASGQAESHRNPSDGATEKPPVTRYKDQQNLDNFVLSHARPETKPSQNEEYKDSYDAYESDGEGDGNSEESDYFLPFGDLLKDIVTSAPSTTTSRTTSTTTARTTTTVTASSAETTTSTTIAPSRSVSSTLPTLLQEGVPANKPPQFPTKSQQVVVPSSLSNDRRPGVTERYDGIIGGHVGYRPGPIIKSEPNRMGAGAVIESTSNIVIPPDQDTVSFVLGNRQNVEGGYYSIGTAVGENPYGSLSDTDALYWPLRNDPQDPTKEVKQEHSPASVTEPNIVTQKWWPPNPSPLKGSNELNPTKPQSPLVVATGTVHDMKNPSKEKDSGYIIFPEDGTKDKDALTEEHIVIINEADGSIRELPPKTTLTTTTTMTNKTKFNPPADDIIGDLPQLAEDLVPPAESSRPPSYYYNYQFDTPRPNHSRPQRLPLPPRIKPPHGGLSVPPLDVGVRKRPYSPDTKLPNILPQFRPNAKASHGHRGPDVIGTMPAGQGAPTRIRPPLPAHPSRRPLPPPPSYLQRLNPPPPPIHAVRLALPTSKVDSVVLPHETEPTIRRLRPPHGVPSISRGGTPEENAPSNRLFAHGGNGDDENGENRKEDRGKSEIADERESEGSERYPEEPPMTPPRPPMFPKRRTADPPRIATLQMIQHHGEFGDEADGAQPAEPVVAQEAERRKSDNHDPSEIPEQPVYVVYPVNTAVNIHPDDSNEKDGSVVVGTRGSQRPLPPDTLLQNEQDDTHTIYNGRPVALDFPYPLERPDPSSVFPAIGVKETPVLIPSEQRQQQQQQQQQAAIANERENEKNDAVNVIPYLQDFLPYRKKNEAAISVTLHRTPPIATSSSTLTSTASTSTPIAYVYTPTHAPHPAHRLDEDDDVNAKQTVLLPSQQPSSSSSSAPAPQNFMAPFVASMSAETPSKNGWSVVVVEPSVGAERKSDSDSDETKPADSENDTQTERNEFDADNFKPQLFGGFKPLYEFPTEDMERHEIADTDTEINMPRHFKEPLPVPDKG